jgi:hypothetical protein
LGLFQNLRALVLEGVPTWHDSVILGSPIELIIVGSRLDLNHLQLGTAELSEQKLLWIQPILKGLLLHNPIYLSTLLLSVEVMKYLLQSLLLFLHHFLLLYHHICSLKTESLKAYLLDLLPAKNVNLITDPVFSVILVYLLQAGANGGLPCISLLNIGVKLLLQSIIFEQPENPFLLVGV